MRVEVQHNHGTHDGNGLRCGVTHLPDGKVVADCVITLREVYSTLKAIQRETLEYLLGVSTAPTERLVRVCVSNIGLTSQQQKMFYAMLDVRWGEREYGTEESWRTPIPPKRTVSGTNRDRRNGGPG